MGVFTRFAILVLCSPWFGTCSSNTEDLCLSGGTPFSERLDVVNGGPLIVALFNWGGNTVMAELVKILVEEGLGYKAVFREGEKYCCSGDGPRSVGACTDCDIDNPPSHVALEIWDGANANLATSPPEKLPDMTEMGYRCQEGMWLTQASVDIGLDLNPPMFAEYYKTLNISAYPDQTITFTNATAVRDAIIDVDVLNSYTTSCERESNINDYFFDSCYDYVRWTGDTGLFNSTPTSASDCEDIAMSPTGCKDGWFLSPACRGDTMDHCIAWVTPRGSWGAYLVMQQAAHWNIPLAMASIPWGAYMQISSVTNSLFYWWKPDSTFMHSPPTSLRGPKQNNEEYDQNKYATSADAQKPRKMLWNQLSQHAPAIKQFLDNMVITDDDMDEIMQNISFGADYRSAACFWARKYATVWETWIPVPTKCIVGSGLMNDQGEPVSSRTNATTCGLCQAGYKSTQLPADMYGSTFYCERCPLGKYQPTVGAVDCDDCAMGFYGSSTGAVKCESCPVGKYSSSPGSQACETCPGGLTTLNIQGKSPEACLCPEGSYLPLFGTDTCVTCNEEYLMCAAGSTEENLLHFDDVAEGVLREYPKLKPSYYSKDSAPLEVVSCKSNDGCSCPGGNPGECFGGREGTACASCPQGMKLTSCGCEDCPAAVYAGFVLAPCVLVCICVALYYFANGRYRNKGSISLTSTIFGGIAFTVMQMWAMLNELSVPWPTSQENMFSTLSVLGLSPETLSMECAVGANPVLGYAFRCCLPAASIAVVFLCYFISKIVGLWKRELGWDLNKAFNTIGAIFQVLFILIVIIAIVPLQCYTHPNGKTSLQHQNQVLCWESDEHYTYMVLGLLVFFCMVFPFTAISVWAIIKAPTLAHVEDFAKRYRFLLYRFRPEVWWWSGILLLRQIVLAFAASVNPDDPHGQSTYVIITIGFYLCFQVRMWPWKNAELNIFEAISFLLIMFIVKSATAFMPQSPVTQTHEHVMWFFLGAIVIEMLAFFLIGVYRFWKRGDLNAEFTSFTNEDLQKCLGKQWVALCKNCGKLERDDLAHCIGNMNAYDHAILLGALNAWNSVMPRLTDSSSSPSTSTGSLHTLQRVLGQHRIHATGDALDVDVVALTPRTEARIAE